MTVRSIGHSVPFRPGCQGCLCFGFGTYIKRRSRLNRHAGCRETRKLSNGQAAEGAGLAFCGFFPAAGGNRSNGYKSRFGLHAIDPLTFRSRPRQTGFESVPARCSTIPPGCSLAGTSLAHLPPSCPVRARFVP